VTDTQAAESKDHGEPRTEQPYEQRKLTKADSLMVVNTGQGKGKSSAAFGTLLRGVGKGWECAVVQFLKAGKWRTGEEKIARQVGVQWFSAGDGFSWDSKDLDESRAKAVTAWEFSRSLIEAGEHQLLVMDEISYPMGWGWIDADEVAAVLRDRPRHVNVILTGREMADAVVEVADTVTEMRKVKHAFDSGTKALRGIDF
jgi:cob(I)alamin adenosyltransferase